MKPIATNHASLPVMSAMLFIAVLAGCGDERVMQVTREAEERQAEQNREIARVVNEESTFRQQAAKLQNDLRADQAAIAQQRDQLEAERRQIASQREWAEFYKPLLETGGVVAAIVAVLGYCGFLVHTLRNSGPGERQADSRRRVYRCSV